MSKWIEYTYRVCSACEWETQRHATFVPECEQCGGHLTTETRRVPREKQKRKRALRSGEGQSDLFDKWTGEHL